MGIDTRIESESGALIRELSDPHSLLSCLIPVKTPGHCLPFIDPYGDTLFNQLQIPHLIDELHAVSKTCDEPSVRRHVEAVLELARTAQGQAHIYVRFVGD